jgi:hypothetical protein
MRTAFALGSLFALAACSPFSATETTANDAATPEGGGGVDGAAADGAAIDGGGSGPCSEPGLLVCADFEDGTLGPFQSAIRRTEPNSAGGTLDVVSIDGGHKALRASLPPCKCPGAGVVAILDLGLDLYGLSDVAPVSVEFDVLVEASLGAGISNFSIMGLFSQTVSNTVFAADAYVSMQGLSLGVQNPSPKFESGTGAPVALGTGWTSVRMDVDYQGGSLALSMAPRGQPFVVISRFTGPAGAGAGAVGPLRVLPGIQRYNDTTPAITATYDFIRVKKQ